MTRVVVTDQPWRAIRAVRNHVRGLRRPLQRTRQDSVELNTTEAIPQALSLTSAQRVQHPVGVTASHHRPLIRAAMPDLQEVLREFQQRGLMFLDGSLALALGLPAASGR